MIDKTLRCYELPELFRAALDRAVDPDTGELTEAGIAEIHALTAAAQSSAADLACYIRELELEADAVKATAAAAAERASRLTARASKWRGYLLETLEMAGIDRVKDPRITVAIQKNPPSVHIADDAIIPPEYCREIPARIEPDKTALKTILKLGAVIPGVELVATARLAIK